MFQKPQTLASFKMENLIIRQAEKNDSAILALLAQQTFMENNQDVFNGEATLTDYCRQHFSIAMLKEQLASDKIHFFLACLDDEVIGYAKINSHKTSNLLRQNGHAQLERIYVKRQYVGMGIGKLLKATLEEFIKEEGLRFLWLHVNPRNENAIRFYKKQGFFHLGEEPFMLGNHVHEALTFGKKIGTS